MKQHKPLAGQASLIPSLCKHLLTVLLFFLSDVYCHWWMYLFLVLNSPLQRFYSVCETEVEAGPPILCLFFVLKISSWESKRTKQPLTRMCEGDIFGIFFFQHNDGLWHFNIIFLSCIWQSVSLFYVSHSVGVLCPYVCEFSLNVHRGDELWPLCVSMDTGRTPWPACATWRLLYLFIELFLGVAILPLF